jgi:NAD(P)-dependent dehydrogenase (short-subunit alcohol dehydrogenase family)
MLERVNCDSAGGHVPAGKITGRVALVTGAARGIGQAIAVRLAADGYQLALADLLPLDKTVLTIESAGGQATAYTCDLAVDPRGMAADPGHPAVLRRLARRHLSFGTIKKRSAAGRQQSERPEPGEVQRPRGGRPTRGW